MLRASRIMVSGLMVLATGCAHRGATVGGTRPLRVRVHVINHYALQIDVFAEAAGTSYQMGTVSLGIDSRFVLRPSLLSLGPVQFVAVPRDAARPFRTPSLQLIPGDSVTLEITSTLFNSTVTVDPAP